MNYIIGVYDDINRRMQLTISRVGNRYQVMLSQYDITPFGKKNTKASYQWFSCISDAYPLFERMARIMVFGLYSTNDRFVIFNNEDEE